jgi:coenzyme F420-reducing hydrogenase alpha subunit
MSKRVILKKATRIEGNANIEIEVEGGRLKSARFQVYDFRGFEKFMQGRRVEYIPALVSRICGLCSTAHQVAGLEALEDALGIEVPNDVRLLREIMVLGEWIGSHALSYFFLTMPDFMGVSGGLFELMSSHPDLVREAIELRKAGQQIIQLLGKRATHPVALTIGGFLIPPTPEDIVSLKEIAARVKEKTRDLLNRAGQLTPTQAEICFPDEQQLNFLAYQGWSHGKEFQVFDREGSLQASFPYDSFADHVSEMRTEWSFAKFPYLTRFGFPQGIVLVGPLARSFQEKGFLLDEELQSFDLTHQVHKQGGLTLESFDLCRLLEIFWAANRILNLSQQVSLNRLTAEGDLDGTGQGIGVLEAPRGTLMHSFIVNRGRLERARLLVATQFNNAYINLLIRELAEQHLENDQLSPQGEWLIGRCIRLFDPCLSCATH